MHVRLSTVATALALTTAVAFAAERGAASATINGKKVTIDYGRPALKGRTMAELIKQLPEDRIWRAGDDQVTTLTTETDLAIGGKKLAAGKYSMYVHLAADGSRSLVINSDLGIPLIKLWDKAPANMANEPWPRLDGYQKNVAGKELVRATMKNEAVKAPVDTFTISLDPAQDGATLRLAWGEESWSIDVKPAK
jgi:uncharacterized protein (DUF2141 family)